MSINSVSLSGNVTRDSDLRVTNNGTSVLNFSVAVNERRKSSGGEWDDYASFIDCVMFGKRADAISRYIHKGTKVSIHGKLSQDRWTDKNTGESRSKLSVVIDEIELMSRREEPTQTKARYDAEEVPF